MVMRQSIIFSTRSELEQLMSNQPLGITTAAAKG
jgi:hypothetical protein